MKSITDNKAVKRRNRWSQEVRDRVTILAAQAMTPADIERDLRLDPHFATMLTPTARTIQRMLADADTAASGTWSFGSGKVERGPDYDRLVLETLAAVVKATKGRVQSLTTDEAEWIVRVRRARPDFSPVLAFRFARRYIAWQAAHTPTPGLDLQLARANPVAEGLDDAAWDRRATGSPRATDTVFRIGRDDAPADEPDTKEGHDDGTTR